MYITEELRLTSVWQYTKTWVVFSGVPLARGSFRSRSGRMVLVVKTPPDILPMKPCIGQHWCITGKAEDRIANHDGFKVTERHFLEPHKLTVTLPHDGEDFIRFIAREPDFKGIGEVKAREIWSLFGRQIFVLLDNRDTETLAQALTERLVESLLDGYEKYANLRYTTWLADHQIPPQIQQRLFKFHKADSIDVIKENPYRLLSFGMSFMKVDVLAQEKFGIQIDDVRRLIAAVEYALQQHAQRGGHTVAHHQDIEGKVRRILGDKERVSKALQQGYTSQTFQLNADTGVYHHTALLIMEKVVAKRLLRLQVQGPCWTVEHDVAVSKAISELPYPLMAKQYEAVITSVAHSVSCISGGAGTGKTTVLRTVLKAYEQLGFNIKAVALSGRATKRLHESIGFATSTIARLLREEPIDYEGKTILVIDEASMVDLGTMYRIINHLHPSVRLLYVGDPNQLPPIGAGLVLSDIIKSGAIVNVELEVVKRQDAHTGIPEYSRMVCQGEVPSQLSVGSIVFHESEAGQINQVCTDLYRQSPSISRIIGATKKVVQEINTQCQSVLNSDAQRLEFREFGDRFFTRLKLDDPVLFTKNDYEAGVQNGSLGTLVSVTQTGRYYGVVRLDGTGEKIKLTKGLLDSLMLGYAITLHKAQGSQFPKVIVALSDTHMIDRAWLYTAITRSEAELHLVGTKRKMHQAIHSLSAHHIRKTHLVNLLREGDGSLPVLPDPAS